MDRKEPIGWLLIERLKETQGTEEFGYFSEENIYYIEGEHILKNVVDGLCPYILFGVTDVFNSNSLMKYRPANPQRAIWYYNDKDNLSQDMALTTNRQFRDMSEFTKDVKYDNIVIQYYLLVDNLDCILCAKMYLLQSSELIHG